MSSTQFIEELRDASILSWADGSDPAYPRNLLWNHSVEHQPLAIVEPRNADDVKLALGIARKHNGKVGVVNAGGHDSRGSQATSPGTMCIDLKHFRSVSFDQTRLEVRVGGGCNFHDVVPHLPDGYEIPLVVVKSVEVAGPYTAGGYGYLTHVLGLCVDNLIGATVILADGTVVECDDKHHPDLMWCLRGGGAGFGVILELRIEVVKLPKMLHASILWPLDERDAVHEAVKTYQEILDEYPDQSSVWGLMSTMPTGPVLALVITFYGDARLAEATVDRLTNLPHAKVMNRGWAHFKDMIDPNAEAAAPRGAHYYSQTQSFTRLSPEIVDVMIDAHLAEPHGRVIIHDMHGISCSRTVEETAFPKRSPHTTLFIVGVAGIDEQVTPELQEQTKRWTDDLSNRLGALDALPGGHPSLLGPENTARVVDWFGPNAERLNRLRKELDPEGRFRGATGDMLA